MAFSAQNIEIVLLARKGDKEAFSKIVDLYSGRLYGYFYRLTCNREDANDLLSELFLKVYEKIGSCRPETFDAWIFKMASNLFTDSLRAKKRREKFFASVQQDFKEESVPEKNGDFMIDKLSIMLKKLDPQTAEIITMRYYSLLSFEELAKIRNEPIGTVLSKVHRGLKKLKELMEQSND
ncbi:MAG: ECF RNA polymerase sigma factor SigW [Planctomycetes bacterium ADurb.Bin401]|nr:MAG: ECF RNA polymerase sigma factor SigW [Planctomycetes bacterium ADurb.Bin401]